MFKLLGKADKNKTVTVNVENLRWLWTTETTYYKKKNCANICILFCLLQFDKSYNQLKSGVFQHEIALLLCYYYAIQITITDFLMGGHLCYTNIVASLDKQQKYSSVNVELTEKHWKLLQASLAYNSMILTELKLPDVVNWPLQKAPMCRLGTIENFWWHCVITFHWCRVNSIGEILKGGVDFKFRLF